MMTKNHKSIVSHNISYVNSDIDSSKYYLVVYDVGLDQNQVDSMSQAIVGMNVYSRILYEFLSDAPLKPWLLNFSKSPSSHKLLEEN